MKKENISILILLSIVVTAFITAEYFYIHSDKNSKNLATAVQQPLTLLVPVENEEGTTTIRTLNFLKNEVETVVATNNKALIRSSVRGSDAGTDFLLYDENTHAAIDLGTVDYIPESLVWSPDKHHVFLATETRVVVINTNTLDFKEVFVPKAGTLHGLSTSFPSFHPTVAWKNNNMLQVTIYASDISNSDDSIKPTPVEVQSISI